MDAFTETSPGYENYVAWMQQVADLRYANAVLQWDQETYMPVAGADMRSRQIATLSEMAHNMFTQPTAGNALQKLAENDTLDVFQRKNVELTRYDYQLQEKLPSAFVRQLSETVSRAFQAWLDARKAKDFNLFQPSLEKLVDLKKQEADLLGYRDHPYNALLNQYEKGCTVALLDHTFEELKPPLQALITRITASKQVENSLLKQFFPEAKQWAFSLDLLDKMGFDIKAGRQDKSAHPFTTNFSSRDVRITTRIDENDLGNMTFSTIHELGHALYEQGLPESQYGLPLGEYASLGIHESQSRLWENNVGRSFACCQHFMPLLKKHFPEQFDGSSAAELYQAVNRVEPSFIRTEADELTYHFHVIVRYELEKALIGGTLQAKDIPAYWNEAYKNFLGITVPDDSLGCLQDVHWSHGSFGYFPTYSLGSLYAAQFFTAASQDIPTLDEKLKQGDYRTLLEWLHKKVHMHGRFFTSEELCRNISGEGLNIKYFMQYVTNKYRFIYAFQGEGTLI